APASSSPSSKRRRPGPPKEGRPPRPARSGQGGPGSGRDRPAGEHQTRGDGNRSEKGRGRGRDRGGKGGRSGREGRRERGPEEVFEHPRRDPVKPVTPVEIPPMDTAFTQLGLNGALGYAVQEMGYTEPTPIQAQAIPVVLAGRDVIGSAQTGTGKTAAFALPILHRLGAHGRMRCLVLEPTRELALQVEEAFQQYSKFTDLTTTIVYGGVGYGKQREDLRRGVDVLAATPGRLLDLLEDGTTHLNDIEILVLDEVDRMLDMDCLPDVKRIVQRY